MNTETTRYLRITMSDCCYSKPMRIMPDDEWRRYLRTLFHQHGFNTNAPISIASKLPGFDVVFSQHRGLSLA